MTPEHISLAHPVLAVHLSLLFRMLLRYSAVPDGFGYGLFISLVKNTEGNQCATDNYRVITISPVISKIFEMVIMRLFIIIIIFIA